MFTFHIFGFWYQGTRVGAHQKPPVRPSWRCNLLLPVSKILAVENCPPSATSSVCFFLLPLLLHFFFFLFFSRKPLPHSSSLFSFKTNTTQTRSQSPLHMRFSATTHTFLLSSLCHSSSPLPLTTTFFSLRYARNPFCTLFFCTALRIKQKIAEQTEP